MVLRWGRDGGRPWFGGISFGFYVQLLMGLGWWLHGNKQGYNASAMIKWTAGKLGSMSLQASLSIPIFTLRLRDEMASILCVPVPSQRCIRSFVKSLAMYKIRVSKM